MTASFNEQEKRVVLLHFSHCTTNRNNNQQKLLTHSGKLTENTRENTVMAPLT